MKRWSIPRETGSNSTEGKVDESRRLPCNMAFCPLDYRYGIQDFKHIWSELGRHERQLEVERALIWAHWQLGQVTEADYEAVAAIANPTDVTKERVSEIEAETRHDIMALTKAMAEAAGEAGWCIHLVRLPTTSSIRRLRCNSGTASSCCVSNCAISLRCALMSLSASGTPSCSAEHTVKRRTDHVRVEGCRVVGRVAPPIDSSR